MCNDANTRFQEADDKYQKDLQRYHDAEKVKVTAIWLDLVFFASPIVLGIALQSGGGAILGIIIYLVIRVFLFISLREHKLPIWGCLATIFLPLPMIAISCLLHRRVPPRRPNPTQFRIQDQTKPSTMRD